MPFHSFLANNRLLRVGGRLAKVGLTFSKCYPILLPGNNAVVKLLIALEYLCPLRVGPTLVAASLSCNLCILGGRWAIRTVV